MQAANVGHAIGYGDDPITEAATKAFHDIFGGTRTFFVFAGTPANVLGLQTMARPFHGVICSSMAHIDVDECGASENYIGCKLLPVRTDNGKITVKDLVQYAGLVGNEHHVQPKVVSLTEATEYGTIYTPVEIRSIAEYAHNRDWFVHMDGARIANAAASLDVSLREITVEAGVDVLSFGGTKNGMMYGEAVVFFNADLARDFKYIRKQGMQLASKMRFISAQFLALLSNDLWLRNALHANAMAQILADGLTRIPGVHMAQRPESNAVFVRIKKQAIPLLQAQYPFYVWNEEQDEVRLMTSWDTTKGDIEGFCSFLEALLASGHSC